MKPLVPTQLRFWSLETNSLEATDRTTEGSKDPRVSEGGREEEGTEVEKEVGLMEDETSRTHTAQVPITGHWQSLEHSHNYSACASAT